MESCVDVEVTREISRHADESAEALTPERWNSNLRTIEPPALTCSARKVPPIIIASENAG